MASTINFADELAKITDEKNDTEKWVSFAVAHICQECLARAKRGLDHYDFYDFETGKEYFSYEDTSDLMPRWGTEKKGKLIPSWMRELYDADKNHMYSRRWKPLIIDGLRAKGFVVVDEYRNDKWSVRW